MEFAWACATCVGLSVFGALVGTCLVLLVAERQRARRERRNRD